MFAINMMDIANRSREKCLILYGSESGKARGMAFSVLEACRHIFSAKVCCSLFKFEHLKKGHFLFAFYCFSPIIMIQSGLPMLYA